MTAPTPTIEDGCFDDEPEAGEPLELKVVEGADKGNNLLDSVTDSSDTYCTLPPWATDKFRLWSILDMQRVYPASWTATLANFADKKCHLYWAFYPNEELTDEHRTTALRVFGEALEALAAQSQFVPLSVTLTAQIDRLTEFYKETRDGDYANHPHLLVHSGSELLQNLLNETNAAYLFFAVPHEKQQHYDDPRGWFGEATMQAFQGIDTDVRDACQAFAFDMWTACVFHCMRVLELGLRSLANDLALPDAEIEDWKNILDRIEKKVRQMEQEPKSTGKIERVQYYSEAAAQFRLFKDAFRNYVSHSRQSYDEQAATKILGGVRDFMETLAKRPS